MNKICGTYGPNPIFNPKPKPKSEEDDWFIRMMLEPQALEDRNVVPGPLSCM